MTEQPAKQTVSLSVNCILCGKSIIKKVDYSKYNDVTLIDIFKDDCYQLQILDMENECEGVVLLWGLLCKDCYKKIVNGEFICKNKSSYINKRNKSTTYQHKNYQK